MHELSIAGAILDVAERHAAGRRVLAVDVRVGHLRQVVPSALEFAWTLVTDGTALEGAALRLETVPARGRCRACATVAELPGFPLACPACGGLDLALEAGEELLVDALEVDAQMTTEGVT
jgi:hydrogenase nickel incorporation protein HypA/HybF